MSTPTPPMDDHVSAVRLDEAFIGKPQPDWRKLCEELVGQLEEREWHSYGDPGDRWDACPNCSGMQERGHESWCELNNLLTRAKDLLK